METRFIKLNAEKSPFLTERLKIFMLPTLALVKNGKVEDYVVCCSPLYVFSLKLEHLVLCV
jgi:hypothetical protein